MHYGISMVVVVVVVVVTYMITHVVVAFPRVQGICGGNLFFSLEISSGAVFHSVP